MVHKYISNLEIKSNIVYNKWPEHITRLDPLEIEQISVNRLDICSITSTKHKQLYYLILR